MNRLLTWLIGPACHMCGERVRPADSYRHRYLEHAGDE